MRGMHMMKTLAVADCALFKTMPKEDVARYKRDHGFVCAN